MVPYQDKRLQAPGYITPGALGSEVQLRCDDVTAVVQLIEADTASEEDFWTLPNDVMNELDRKAKAAEARSAKHRRHPAVGYKSIPTKQRPTYPGSSAEACEDNKVVSDRSEEDSEEEPLINNASRLGSVRVDTQRVVEQKSEPVPDVVLHDVVVIFGQTDNRPDLWLAVQLPCKTKGKVRVQFLEEVCGESGMFFLCFATATYRPAQIQHTFEKVEFVNEPKGKDICTRTRSPLDPTILDKLSKACAAFK